MDARHYTTVYELKASMGTKSQDQPTVERLRTLIREASRQLEMYTNRRFDWRVETHGYRAWHVSHKGDLLSETEVKLREDCQSVTAVTNLGAVVPLGELTLNTPLVSFPYKEVLTWSSEWQSQGSSQDIQVTGVWGYGGAMLQLQYTLAADLSDSATSLNITGVAGLEYGMLIRIDDEYLIIDDESASLTATSVHVARGVNGTQAATHTSGTTLYVFVADYMVQRVVKRLARWMSALNDNPLFSSAVVGDVQIPFNPSAWPHDLRRDVDFLTKSIAYIGKP